MASIVPNPRAIRAFANSQVLERWLKANHDREPELYLRIYKKASGVATVTHLEAIDVALCWGWIDGVRKSYDADSFLQRFSPRKAKSIWSQINRRNVERLIAAGRMTPHGQRHIDAAKADGRWDKAYAGSSTMRVPRDLLLAIRAEPKAFSTFRTLNRQNLYALAFRTEQMKTAEGRSKKIASLVAMLKEGKTLHPNGKAKGRAGSALEKRAKGLSR